MNNSPLLSIVVITYNSSNTILETLDSIYKQTYSNIELIITDDCSTDDTVKTCSNWIKSNKSHFFRTELLTIDHNTGVSANLNRGFYATTGSIIKEIAGDDILLPNAITDIVEYLSNNPKVNFAFGKMHYFSHDIQLNDPERNTDESFFMLTATEQYKHLVIKGNCLTAPTFFYRKKAFEQLPFRNDETIPLCEDFPKWLRITQSGHKFYQLDSYIVNYRVSNSALSSVNHSDKYKLSRALTYNKYCFRAQLKEKTRQAIFIYLCTKGFITRNKLYKVMRMLFEYLDYALVICGVKRIDKSYKHYYNY